jgi:GTP cyclohydrolase I
MARRTETAPETRMISDPPEPFKSWTAEEHIREAIMLIFSTDFLDDPSTKDTPRRIVQYMEEFNQPFDVMEIFGEGFAVGANEHADGIVVQSDIPFRMVCEHHFLPATGHAYIGYIPNGRVVGISKIARLVDAVGTDRPSLQELITSRIADAFMTHLQAKGVIVVIKAAHSCMTCRGVKTPDTLTSTSVVRGLFRDVPSARAEFFAVAGVK